MAEAVLQHLASFSVSGRNTLTFLRAIRNRFTLNHHMDQSVPRDAHLEQGKGDMSQQLLDARPPLYYGEDLATNELGFLAPLEISEMQCWFPEPGFYMS